MMRHNALISIIITCFVLFLGACSNNDNDIVNNTNGTNEPSNQNNDENNKIDDNQTNNENDESDANSRVENFKVETEDQLDLEIGDTGKFDTTLGTYEITLNSAELVGEEFDGELTQLEDLILLNITIKNTSKVSLDLEDIISSLEITEDLDGSGYGDGAEDFSSLEKLTGMLEPNEEVTGPFITDAYHSDEYYFRENPGNVGAGFTTQVIWTFTAEEAQ